MIILPIQGETNTNQGSDEDQCSGDLEVWLNNHKKEVEDTRSGALVFN